MMDHVFFKHSTDANFKMKCFYAGCHKSYNNYFIFKSHFLNKHKATETTQLKYKCCLDICDKKFIKLNEFISHYYYHIENEDFLGKDIRCLFDNERCRNYIISTKSGYLSHISRIHRNREQEKVRTDLLITQDSFSFASNIDTYDITDDLTSFVGNSNYEANNTNLYSDEIKEFVFKLYYKYKDKHLIPKYICDEMLQDISSFLNLNNKSISSFVDECKQKYNDPNDIVEIVKSYCEKTIMLK
jgi:hypothetical protein